MASMRGRDVKTKIQEKKLLESELKSLKKGARVFKQQQNSNLYFLADKEKVFKECKESLDDLISEYKEAERCTEREELGEESEDIENLSHAPS